MDEFARLMMRENVKPLADKNKRSTSVNSQIATPAPSATMTMQAGPEYAWAQGDEARKTINSALERVKQDLANGGSPWINAFDKTGKASPFRPTATLAEIITRADREELRLIVIAGAGFSCVMHPAMGIATIEEDPD